MTRAAPYSILSATKAKDMDDPAQDRTGPGKALIVLAMGAALMSGAFFVHARHAANAPAVAGGNDAHLLPGLTLVNAQPGGVGIIVTSLETGGQAARLGVAVGDDVVRMDDQPIASLDQAGSYLVQHPRPRIRLGLLHGGERRAVTLDRTEGAR